MRQESLYLREIVNLLDKLEELKPKDYTTIEKISNTINLSKNEWKIVKDSILIVYNSDLTSRASLEINTSAYCPIRRKDEYVIVRVMNYPFSGEGRFQFILLDVNKERGK